MSSPASKHNPQTTSAQSAPTTGNDDTFNMQHLRTLHAQFSSALSTFAASPSLVHILHTYPPPSSPSPSPSTTTTTTSPTPCRTAHLLVLDSSFNPPSIAHRHVAVSALRATISSSPVTTTTATARAAQQPPPPRLLLLLATANADKAPQPASFADRAVMMALLARDVAREIDGVVVDVGVTKEAFFVGKARAIEMEGGYVLSAAGGTADDDDDGGGDGDGEVEAKGEVGEDEARYVQQTHLVGFDTLVRLFDRKYYGEGGLVALKPLLGRHRVRAMLRATGNEEGGRERELERQRGWLRGLVGQVEGFEDEWLRRVDVVEGGGVAEGVSSTRVREAVGRGDWGEVERLVGGGVAGWVRERGLYLEERDKERERL